MCRGFHLRLLPPPLSLFLVTSHNSGRCRLRTRPRPRGTSLFPLCLSVPSISEERRMEGETNRLQRTSLGPTRPNPLDLALSEKEKMEYMYHQQSEIHNGFFCCRTCRRGWNDSILLAIHCFISAHLVDFKVREVGRQLVCKHLCPGI